MSSLYNMTAEYQALLAKEDFNDIDLIELDKLHDNIEDRIVYYGGVIQEMKAKLAATQMAIQIASEKRKRIEGCINRLEEYVIASMIHNKITSVEKSPLFDIKVRHNPVSVDDYEPKCIPQEYWITKQELQLDKKKVKEDIENLGLVIPGVRLQRKVSLSIK